MFHIKGTTTPNQALEVVKIYVVTNYENLTPNYLDVN